MRAIPDSASADPTDVPEATLTSVRFFRRLLLLGLLMLGSLFALLAGSQAAQADPEASSTMNAWQGWSLGKNPDVRVNDPITLYGTIDWCSGLFCIRDNIGGGPYTTEWRLGDGSPVQSQPAGISGSSGSLSVSRTVIYTSVGAFQPELRACGASGCTGWDKYDVVLVNQDLDVGPNQNPSTTSNVWSPNDHNGVCAGGGGRDGRPNTNFTFSATVDDPENDQIAVEWDFDDNGTVDARTPSSGYQAEGTKTTVHAMGVVGSWEPKARAVDDHGGVGGWDKYDCVFTDINLDTVQEAPNATMQWWSPCYEILGVCSGGSPDGRPATTFTFTADYSDADSDLGGLVTGVQWDFNGDGVADSTQTFAGSASGTRTTTYTYNTQGVFQPQVRFQDNDGLWSGWDKKDILGINIDLDVVAVPPEATMQWWSPCYQILGVCSPGSPDGRPGTTFTFTADFNDPDSGAGSRVNKVEWDFDGNGTVDQTQTFANAASGTRTTTYSYGVEGVFEPQVRFTDIDGAVSSWDKYDNALCLPDFECDLDVVAVPPEATMQWWSPCYQILGVCSPGSPDGRPGTTFTFTADYNDPDSGAGSQVVQVQWDFDGDGITDQTQNFVGGGSGTRTVTHNYGAEVVVQPQVRFVDNDGAVSSWDKFDILFIPIDLDAVISEPEATMQWWSPCYEILGVCSPGSPDGRPGTTFTFTADYNDPDSGLGGKVTQLQWDYNDDCAGNAATNDPCIDKTQAVGPAASGTATSTHSYGAVAVTEPKVRSIDNDGGVGSWDKYDNVLCLPDFNCDLDAVITPPDAEGRFTPYSILGYDGTTTTVFNFDASESTDGDAHLGGAIVSYQWDFNGDSVIDRTTVTPTTQMTYAQFGFGPGSYAATVTVVDNDGATDTDQFDDNPTGLVPVNVDIVAACVGDVDGDGVPCDFDPDDNSYYRERLDYVVPDGSSNTLLTNFDPDAAALTPVRLTRQNILGQSMVQGQMTFVNADVVPSSQFREAIFNLWVNTAIGSNPDTAYVRG
ncbi:MAG: PKD domain-containing protein, partial [Actinobacteria bacterium ATB1]|nr:PKD domain-containing protein [Actinobacteria bacterium ATB1]